MDYIEAKIYSSSVAAKIATTAGTDGKVTFLTRNKVKELLVQTGEWNDQLEQELFQSYKTINDLERKLAKGGIKKSEGKNIALSIKALRNRQVEILSKTRSMDEYTIEAQTDNANFDFLCSCCILDEEGNRVFKHVDDYKNNNGEDIIVKCASKLAEILYGYDDNAEKSLPENQFLIKYGFVNDKMQFVDKDGNLVDESGRRVDANGRLVDSNGGYIDFEGNPLEAEGNPVEEFQEFIDD